MSRVLNFTLCPQNDKKLISGVFLQQAKDLFFHFLKQEILRLYSLRMTNGFEFLVRLITIDLALE
jgi:hypothetical protein